MRDEYFFKPGETEMILLKTNDVSYFTEKYVKIGVYKVKHKNLSADQ